MGFFDITGNNGENTAPTNTDTTLIPGKMQLRDADGNILTSVPLTNGRASFTRTVTDANIGQNNLQATYTGDSRFAGRNADSFNSHVADANGNNATAGKLNNVTQIVAGPGLYISSPNGQGVVTVSTQPLQTSVSTDTLFDVAWTTQIDSPYGIVGQFVAVGMSGANASSRDGHNWSHMKPFADGHGIIGVSTEINSAIPDNHLEYNGVGGAGMSYYGRAGINGDAIYTSTQLSDQHGPISQSLVSTFIFNVAGANSSGGGGGGGSTSTGTTSTSSDFVIAAYDSNNFNAPLAYTPFGNATDSSDLSLSITPPGTQNWSQLFGLDSSYASGGVHQNMQFNLTFKFNGTTFIPANGAPFTWPIGDSGSGGIYTVEWNQALTSPIDSIPQQSSMKGKVFDANLMPFTFTQGQANTVTIILTFTDAASTVHTKTATVTATWS